MPENIITMKSIYYLLIAHIGISVIFISCKSNSQPSQTESWNEKDLYANIEFEMPKVSEPVFAAYSVLLTDFGAVGDGITKNTDAFEKAILDVTANGGGKVIVPRGIWLTGPIILKSDINLHLEDGSLIVFSKDFDDYPLIETSFEGLNTYRCLSPISGKDLENIAITGTGIIDGSGDAWRPVKKEKLTERQWKELVRSGGAVSDDGKIWYPSEKSKLGDSRDNFNVPDFKDPKQFEDVKDFLRPVMVSLINCRKVLLDGPTFQNSPAWNIHPLMCEDVTIRNLTVRNPWHSQNGDGLDLESCKNVVIYNNNFDVGDDAICFKSGKNEDGRERGMPTENIIVTNNIVYHGHGGFTIGSEMSGGVKNVHISNCTFIGTDIGLRFKSTRGRGGVVENIHISNIDMIDIPAEAIRFNLFYEGNPPIFDGEDQNSKTENKEEQHVPVTEETPSFKNIFMKNITATSSGIAAFFQGLPEMPLLNVTLEDAILDAEKGITLIDAEGIEFKNVKLKIREKIPLTIYNSTDVTFNSIILNNDPSQNMIRVIGRKTKNIRFTNSSISADQLKKSTEVSADAVIFSDTM